MSKIVDIILFIGKKFTKSVKKQIITTEFINNLENK